LTNTGTNLINNPDTYTYALPCTTRYAMVSGLAQGGNAITEFAAKLEARINLLVYYLLL